MAFGQSCQVLLSLAQATNPVRVLSEKAFTGQLTIDTLWVLPLKEPHLCPHRRNGSIARCTLHRAEQKRTLSRRCDLDEKPVSDIKNSASVAINCLRERTNWRVTKCDVNRIPTDNNNSTSKYQFQHCCRVSMTSSPPCSLVLSTYHLFMFTFK